MAIAMPMSTNTKMAPCIQIHDGDMTADRLARPACGPTAPRGRACFYRVLMASRPPKQTVALALSLLVWLGAVGAAAGVGAASTAGAAGASRAAGAGPRGRRATTALLGGVNIGGVDSMSTPAEANREIAAAHELHARLVRLAVPWSVLEPEGPDEAEPRALAYTDRVVEDAAADGIGVIMMVQSTPCWVSSAPASLLRSCEPGREGRANAWPPTQPSAFAAFCAYLARRYGSRLAAIEVWNEPDQANEQYLAGPNKAERYAALLRAAYPAIKAASPGVLVLGGAFVGPNGAFLRLLYSYGIKGYYDGLAVHFYTLTLGAVRYTHEVQLANGDTTPLWLTEFGWSSCWPHESIEQEQGCVTPRIQATNLANTFRALARSAYVAAAVAYKLQDSTAEDFGALSASGARKPAFAAVAGALSSPLGPISPITLRLRRRGGHVIASGSGPVGDYMRLEVLRGTKLRYWALFTLNRFDDYSIALPTVVSAPGLRVRVYQYWSGLASAVEKKIV